MMTILFFYKKKKRKEEDSTDERIRLAIGFECSIIILRKLNELG